MDNSCEFFDKLKCMGLDNFNNMELYKKKEEKNDKNKGAGASHLTPLDLLYDRSVECPVCNKQIKVRAVKLSSIRVLGKDSDFMTYYQEPNPMFYDAWLCTNCGYAALSSKFKTVTAKQCKLINENITARWKFNKIYPPVYNANIAIEIHQLALLNTVVKMGKDSEKAGICLKLAWLYRLAKDEKNENKFISQALKGFLSAYENEEPPIAGLDEPSVEYLMGELYRRLDDTTNALKWLSKAIVNRNAKIKIKDMARLQKDIILGEKTSSM